MALTPGGAASLCGRAIPLKDATRSLSSVPGALGHIGRYSALTEVEKAAELERAEVMNPLPLTGREAERGGAAQASQRAVGGRSGASGCGLHGPCPLPCARREAAEALGPVGSPAEGAGTEDRAWAALGLPWSVVFLQPSPG